MKRKTPLLDLLQGFTKKELQQIKRLAESSYWGMLPHQKTLMIKLTSNSIKKREKAYREEEKRNPKNFRKTKNTLRKFLEDYIVLLLSRDNSINRDIQLLHYYNDRGLDKTYQDASKLLQRKIEEYPQDLDSSLQKFRFYEIQASRSRKRHKFMPELPKMKSSLEQFYQEQKHRIFCEIESQKQGINASYTIDYDKGIILELLSHLQKLLEHNTKNEDKKQSYLRLKKHLFEEAELSGTNIKKMIYIHLINFSIHKINAGMYTYAGESYALIQHMMEDDLYLENNRLDYARFRNTIMIYAFNAPTNTARIRLFIKKYYKYLDALNPSVIKNLYESYILILEQKFNEAKKILDDIKENHWKYVEDAFHKLQHRKMEIQIMYLKLASSYSSSFLQPKIIPPQIHTQRIAIEREINLFKEFVGKQDEFRGTSVLQLCQNFGKLLRRQVFYQNLTTEKIETTALALSDKLWLLSII